MNKDTLRVEFELLLPKIKELNSALKEYEEHLSDYKHELCSEFSSEYESYSSIGISDILSDEQYDSLFDLSLKIDDIKYWHFSSTVC